MRDKNDVQMKTRINIGHNTQTNQKLYIL